MHSFQFSFFRQPRRTSVRHGKRLEKAGRGKTVTDEAHGVKTHDASVSLRRFLRTFAARLTSLVQSSLVRAAWSLFRVSRWAGRARLPLYQQEGKAAYIQNAVVSTRREELHRMCLKFNAIHTPWNAAHGHTFSSDRIQLSLDLTR